MEPNCKELIQEIVQTINAQSYLEVGVCRKTTYDYISCSFKVCVDTDPLSGATYTMTSDKFFEINSQSFDVIFIDACHNKENVLRDINNSLKCLNFKGVIITHDTLPYSPYMFSDQYCWNAWEAFAYLRKTNPNIFMASIETWKPESTGCGVITYGTQSLYMGDIISTWDGYSQDRSVRMNIITVESLLDILKSNLF